MLGQEGPLTLEDLDVAHASDCLLDRLDSSLRGSLRALPPCLQAWTEDALDESRDGSEQQRGEQCADGVRHDEHNGEGDDEYDVGDDELEWPDDGLPRPVSVYVSVADEFRRVAGDVEAVGQREVAVEAPLSDLYGGGGHDPLLDGGPSDQSDAAQCEEGEDDAAGSGGETQLPQVLGVQEAAEHLYREQFTCCSGIRQQTKG